MTPPASPHLPSVEGLHAYVERHFGPWTARIVGVLVILGICGAAIGVIWGVVERLYSASASAIQGRTVDVLWQGFVGPGISLLLLAAFGWYVVRRVKAESRRLDLVSQHLGEQLHILSNRVTGIESVVKSIVPPLDLSNLLRLELSVVQRKLSTTLRHQGRSN